MLKNIYNWIKKKIAWLFVGGVVLAAGTGGIIYGDMTKNEVSLEKLTQKYNQATEIKAKYILNGAVLIKTDIKNPELDKYKNEPKDEIKITLGDKNKAEFVPNIELKRWNEVSFKLKTDNFLSGVADKDKGLKFDKDKIKFDTPKISFEMYDYAEGEGGYKFIWYLNEKPATNKVEFDIESSELDFYRQPPLTEEYQNGYSEEFQKEIVVSETQVKDLEGNVLVERPENVVGSYAVYHSTKGGMNDINGKEYKTGQAFMIYRPHIIDAEGKETWGILHIENGIYSVEIPQEFLDTAVYPIKSNDTFGYTSVGGSTDYWVDRMYGCLASPVSNGIVTKITWYSAAYSSSYYGNAVTALYDGVNYVDLLEQTDAVYINWTTKDWHDWNFSTQPDVLSNTTYFIVWWDQKYTRYHYNTAASKWAAMFYTGVFPDTMAWSDNTQKVSIYATYTPGVGNGAAPEVQQILWEE